MMTPEAENNNKIEEDLEKVEAGGRWGLCGQSGSVRRRWRRAAVMFVIGATAVAFLAALWYLLGWLSVLQLILVALVAYIAGSGSWKWFYIAYKTFNRDTRALIGYVKLLRIVRHFNNKNMTLPDIFDATVAVNPDKPCFLFLDEVWSFAKIQEYSYRVANVFRAHGYRKGQAVGLLASNCAQYPAVWLGLSRLGVIVPLINNNQRSKALLHSITIGQCDAVIYAEEYEQAIKDISGEISPSISLYRWNPDLGTVTEDKTTNVEGEGERGIKDLTSLLKSASTTAPAHPPDRTFHDKLMYIFTSGTTGLPKAAVITQSRYMFMVGGIHYLTYMTEKDIVYTSLPLYHSAGCITALGQAIIFGSTVAIRSKFSASNFIKDCIKYNATAANYIGEMCRYLLATPPSEMDKQHKLKFMYGNGLRPQIWQAFMDRFSIPKIVEFYGATEGNANIGIYNFGLIGDEINVDGRVGAIGFVSRIFPYVYPIALIRVDEQTGEPIRNAKGLCQSCRPNEVGVFIGKINPGNPTRAFLGYVDKAASEKKIVKNVFSHGDSAFISGDILTSDEFGYLYFKDRTGDTFRWRGENVSTSEVEAAVSQIADHKDAVVYGVLIPNVEGRAGMCGIADPDGNLDLVKLAAGLKKDLPSYARPIFIRVLKQVDLTGTFKLKKTEIQAEGFNPSTIKDKLYYMDAKSGEYILLNQDIYDKIISGQMRL